MEQDKIRPLTNLDSVIANTAITVMVTTITSITKKIYGLSFWSNIITKMFTVITNLFSLLKNMDRPTMFVITGFDCI